MVRQISSRTSGARPSVASSRISRRGLVRSARRDGQHLLLAAGELVAGMAAGAGRGVETAPARAAAVQSVRAIRAGPLRDSQMLGNAQAREDAAAFRHVGEAGSRAQEGWLARGVAPSIQRRPRRAGTRPMRVRMSVVLPMPLRPMRPMALAGGEGERHAAQDVACAVVRCAGRRRRRRCGASAHVAPRGRLAAPPRWRGCARACPRPARRRRPSPSSSRRPRTRSPCRARSGARRGPAPAISAARHALGFLRPHARHAAHRAAARWARRRAPWRSRAGADGHGPSVPAIRSPAPREADARKRRPQRARSDRAPSRAPRQAGGARGVRAACTPRRTFSRTVSGARMLVRWNERPMPRCVMRQEGSPATSRP